jgi:periplasmic protein TonB
MSTLRILHLLRNTLLGLGATVVASSCSLQREAPDASLPESSPSVGPGHEGAPESAPADVSAAPLPPPVPEPPILTLSDYKVAVARRIALSNPEHLYEGAPPPMLKSVVVLAIAVDEEGLPVRLRVMRGNGHRTLEQRALQSVKQATPLPRPGALARRGVTEFNETWLFREDGRFQLRSTAEAQADS